MKQSLEQKIYFTHVHTRGISKTHWLKLYPVTQINDIPRYYSGIVYEDITNWITNIPMNSSFKTLNDRYIVRQGKWLFVNPKGEIYLADENDPISDQSKILVGNLENDMKKYEAYLHDDIHLTHIMPRIPNPKGWIELQFFTQFGTKETYHHGFSDELISKEDILKMSHETSSVLELNQRFPIRTEQSVWLTSEADTYIADQMFPTEDKEKTFVLNFRGMKFKKDS